MSKPKRRKDISRIIFWILGIELLVAAAVIGYYGVRYIAPLMGEVLSVKGGSSQTGGKQGAANQPQQNQNQGNQPQANGQADDTVPQQTEETVHQVTLVAAGDNLMHRSCTMSAKQVDGSFNFDQHFANISSVFQSADLAVISQDTVMGGIELGATSSETGIFNTATELADSMAGAGLDVVLTANNHTLDQGRTGLDTMKNYFTEHYPLIELLGTNESAQDQERPVYVEKNGITFALINYSNISNNTAELETQPWLMNLYDEEWLDDILAQARENADFIIAFPFWGQQNSLEVTEDELQQAQFLADRGVDLIIGTYPHVVEPVSWITAENGDKTLVYYSLGNFQSIQNTLENMLGGLAEVTITKEGGNTSITDYDLGFVVTHYEQQAADDYYDIVTTYPLEQYTEELAQRHGIRSSAEPDFSKAALDGLSSSILSRSEMQE